MPQEMTLSSIVVKSDSKIIILLNYSKSSTHSVIRGLLFFSYFNQNFSVILYINSQSQINLDLLLMQCQGPRIKGALQSRKDITIFKNGLRLESTFSLLFYSGEKNISLIAQIIVIIWIMSSITIYKRSKYTMMNVWNFWKDRKWYDREKYNSTGVRKRYFDDAIL